MRKKIKNEIKEMVANADWANAAPDNDNYYTMAYLYPPEVSSNKTDVAKAVLTCRPDSHPFPERTLLLNQPVKVGRAVGKIRAAPDNAIFDCKVLSRHHASLWYNNGHFYLQDTKSSNGTFVNNHRLSEGSKESAPYEVCSEDIVQFGVDVLENSCSVTHGCIVATLRLFLPDGKEAKASQSTIVKSPTHIEDLYVLNNVLQEAIQREHLLEGKLRSLRSMVECCGAALEHTWRSLCSEERLIAHVQFLERRLAAVSTASQQAQQPTELQQLIDDKHQYEMNATEALRIAHEEKLKLLNQLGSVQWSMCSSEEECAVLRGHVDRAHQDLQDLGEKKTVVEKELRDSKEALETAIKQIERLEIVLKFKEETNKKNREKAENNENGYPEDVIDRIISSENFDSMSLILNHGKTDQNNISLTEAIRGLPEYIKALLPEPILQEVGCKTRLPSFIKDLEVKLYSLKNELFILENIQSDDKANDNTSSCESEPLAVTETDTENKTNSEYHNSTDNLDSSKLTVTIADEECNRNDITIQENKEVDNANEMILDNSLFLDKLGAEATKEMKTKLLKEKIGEISEQLELINGGEVEQQLVVLQKELKHAEAQIATLFKDLEVTNNSLTQSSTELFQLKQVKNKLFTENEDLKKKFSMKVEECRKLETTLSQSQPDEREKTDEHESSKYKEEVMQLQKRLDDLLKSEANTSDEIERLNSTISELRNELQERPFSSDIDQQKKSVKSLQDQLTVKEKQIEEFKKQVSILMEVQVSLEEKLNKITSDTTQSNEVIDKMIMTDTDEDSENQTVTEEPLTGPIVISPSLAVANGFDEDQLTYEDPSIASISIDLKRLEELEEELVLTREKWSLINEDKTKLALQLQMVNDKYKKLLNRSLVDMLVYILPLVAMLIYILLYQYIS